MRLLLAEDEPSLSRAVCAILKKNNYEVDAVFDGEEALDYLAAGNYDGAILDVMMPKKDGFAVLKELRASGSALPVLILSARTEVDDKVTGLDLGANDYLAKPFAAPELLARIRAMTRTAAAQTTSVLAFGNITLDQTSFVLASPAGSYTLAGREYQMLELLMSNPHRLISTEQFMDKIWGFDSEADVSVVWVYISYLRKKLSALGATVQIRASRGLGYSLEEIAK